MCQAEFNPYREWLDLSADPTNYYELLGLEAFENDTEKIRRAARSAISRVRKVKPGAHRRCWTRLLDQLDLVRQSLGDASRKSEYDRALAAGTSRFELVQGESIATTPAAGRLGPSSLDDPMAPLNDLTRAAPEPPPSAPRPPAPNHAVPETAPPASARPLDPRRPRAAKSRRPRAALWGVVCGAIGFIALAVTLRYSLRFDGRMPLAPQRPIARSSEPRGSTAPTTRTDPESVGNEPRASAISIAEPDLSAAYERQAERTEGIDVSPPSLPTSQARPTPQVRPTPQEIEQFNDTLALVWASLQSRQLDRAADHLERASALAKTDKQREMVAHHETLRHYVAEFWEAVEDGMDLIAGEELVLGRNRVSVVDVTSTEVILRVRGERREFARDQLPTELAVAIADRWFDLDAPSTYTIKGAWMAVTPAYSQEQVRQMWRKAAQAGVDLADLDEVLRHRPQ